MTNPLDWDGTSFLTLYVVLATLAVCGVGWLRGRFGPGGPVPLDATEAALLAAGRQRAADALLIERMVQGSVRFEPATRGFSEGGTKIRRARFLRDMLPRLREVEDRLRARGLLASPMQIVEYRVLAAAVVAPPLMLGFAKMCVGLQRGRPVGILVVAMLVTLLVVGLNAGRRPLATRRARLSLAAMRSDNARLVRAPLGAELALAFALVGPAALDPRMARAFASSSGDGGFGGDGGSDSGSGDSGGSSGGDSGGGGGGSGCGGCSS